MKAVVTAVALFLGTFGQLHAQSYYPGPQSGYYVYGPDHEYHLLSRNQPFMVLRQPLPLHQPWHCNPQFDPDCNLFPPPGYPAQPMIPIAPPQPPSMEASREAVIRAGEAHCKR